MTRTWSPTVFSSPAMVYGVGRREGGRRWGGLRRRRKKEEALDLFVYFLCLPGAASAEETGGEEGLA